MQIDLIQKGNGTFHFMDPRAQCVTASEIINSVHGKMTACFFSIDDPHSNRAFLIENDIYIFQCDVCQKCKRNLIRALKLTDRQA